MEPQTGVSTMCTAMHSRKVVHATRTTQAHHVIAAALAGLQRKRERERERERRGERGGEREGGRDIERDT